MTLTSEHAFDIMASMQKRTNVRMQKQKKKRPISEAATSYAKRSFQPKTYSNLL